MGTENMHIWQWKEKDGLQIQKESETLLVRRDTQVAVR